MRLCGRSGPALLFLWPSPVDGYSTDSKIAWYTNDGTGQFGPQQVISNAAIGANCVYTVDLDGDGDLDVLSASHTWTRDGFTADSEISSYENRQPICGSHPSRSLRCASHCSRNRKKSADYTAHLTLYVAIRILKQPHVISDQPSLILR